MPHAKSVPWSREHSLIALNLYHKLPFGKLHRKTPQIMQAAEKMGRTAGSLAMKLSNFASFVPVLQARGISGLSRTSHKDRHIWDEFNANFDTLGPESEQLLSDLFNADADHEVEMIEQEEIRLVPTRLPPGVTEASATVTTRRGHSFFRQAVLTAYGGRCCISGIAHPRFLIASHIKPWRDHPRERLDLRNGLCLSTLHDAAFDAGLITLDEEYRVVLSKEIRQCFADQQAIRENFKPYAGLTIRLPEKNAKPDAGYLAYHRGNVFVG